MRNLNLIISFSLIGLGLGILLGSYLSKQLQIQDNIKHGVMNKEGKWLNKFKLAE